MGVLSFSIAVIHKVDIGLDQKLSVPDVSFRVPIKNERFHVSLVIRQSLNLFSDSLLNLTSRNCVTAV